MNRSLLKTNETTPSSDSKRSRAVSGKKGFFLYDPKNKSFIEIKDGFLCGRDEGDLKFPKDEAISRKHCVFTITEANVFISDLGSTNGTLLNSLNITSGHKRRLYVNDLIVIGNQRFIFTNQNQRIPGNIQDSFKDDSRRLLVRKGAGTYGIEKSKFAEVRTGLLVEGGEFRRIKIRETLRKLSLAKKPTPALAGISLRHQRKTSTSQFQRNRSTGFFVFSVLMTVLGGLGLYLQSYSPPPLQDLLHIAFKSEELTPSIHASITGSSASAIIQLMNPQNRTARSPSNSLLQKSKN